MKNAPGLEVSDELEIDIQRPTLSSINEGQLKEVMTEFVRESYKVKEGLGSVDDEIEHNVETAMRLIGQNRFYTAMHNGEIIGVIGLIQQGSHPDYPGRDFFESTQSFTKLEFRGKKVNTKLRQQLFADLENDFPDYLLFTISPNPAVYMTLLNNGHIEMENPERLFEIITTRPEFDQSQTERIRSLVGEWVRDSETKILIFDSKQNSGA